MKMWKLVVAVMMAVGLLQPAADRLQADEFGSGGDPFTIDFVTVGDPGNADDTHGNGYGGVEVVFRIAMTAVSQGMIESYNALSGGPVITILDLTPYGGNGPARPATGVSWNEAARFVNWLNTSSGHSPAYKFTTGGANDHLVLWSSGEAGYDAGNPFRNSNARYFLPGEDEWYKAAYYDGIAGVYYDYAIGSDSPPVATTGGTAPGTAVYGQTLLTGPADVGNAGGLSPYGTRGQNGNTWELTESAYAQPNDLASENRVLSGGYWNASLYELHSSYRPDGVPPEYSGGGTGFRVAGKAGAPEIAVEHPAGTNLIDGSASVDFGAVVVGETGMAVTCTIRNTGDAVLALGSGVSGGGNAGDFTVDTTGMSSSLPPAGVTSFSVTFAPSAGGPRSSTLQITSNDGDENPFDIALAGRGLSTDFDFDNDGMNDLAEHSMSALGFDWEVDNSSLVGTLRSNAALLSLRTAEEIQGDHEGAALIEVSGDAIILDLQLQKSSDLAGWDDLYDPMRRSEPAPGKRLYWLFPEQP